MTKQANGFDVLKEMSKRNMDIRGFPLHDNLKSANIYGKNGEITLLVDPATVHDLLIEKPLVGMLIIADRSQYDAVMAELSEAMKEGGDA